MATATIGKRLPLLLLLPLLLFFEGEATDYAPWFPRYLEFQPSLTYLHQQYCQVDEGRRVIYWRSKDDFYHAALELAYGDYCGELELAFSSSKSHHLGPDNAKATFRYQLLDDIVGDFASVVAGMSVTQVFTLSLHDISTFHHGGIEGELHLAMGRECTWRDSWSYRWWVMSAIGCGDHGSPWLHGEAALEKNLRLCHRLKFFAVALYGLGDRDLDVFQFDNYGDIRHQSIDLGASYRYLFPFEGAFTLGAFYRIHATNCPRRVAAFFLSYLYPFGL